MSSHIQARGIAYKKVTSLNEGPAVIIATWIIAVISILMVFSRLGIKIVVLRRLQVDDYLIVAAMIFGIAQSVAVSEQAQNGLGDYLHQIARPDRIKFQKSYFAANILYIITLCLAKLSVLAFIHGLTPDVRQTRIIRAVGFVTILLGVTSLFSAAFECGLPHPWQTTLLKCFNLKAFWTWVGVWDIVIDFAIFCSPLLFVYKLKTSVSRKIIVLACFSGRFLAIIATISRLFYLNKYPVNDTAGLWIVVVCTQVELGITISSTSVPYMRPFFEALESGVWRSDELRRRGLTVEDLYGNGLLKSWQAGIARNTTYLELVNVDSKTPANTAMHTDNRTGSPPSEHGVLVRA